MPERVSLMGKGQKGVAYYRFKSSVAP